MGIYTSGYIQTGVIHHCIIRAKAKDEKDDPFDKKPLEMKNWVRGIVWRNEFFKDTMIADIAKREKVDPRHVGHLIDASLNIGG